jgi:hypothetical protein
MDRMFRDTGSPASIRPGRLHLDRLPVLSALTAILSNLVSSVPAVVVLDLSSTACATRSGVG